MCPIDVPEVSVEDGQRYTVAATNVLDSIEAQVLVDTGIAPMDQALVRFVHLAADAPPVDVLTQDGSATDRVEPGLPGRERLPGARCGLV